MRGTWSPPTHPGCRVPSKGVASRPLTTLGLLGRQLTWMARCFGLAPGLHHLPPVTLNKWLSLTCKTGMIMATASQGCWEERVSSEMWSLCGPKCQAFLLSRCMMHGLSLL